jgi:hypothetical protein
VNRTLTAMKRFFFSLIAITTGFFILGQCFISAESFAEGVGVSPETVTLNSGQYIWERERAPEG